MLFTDYLYESSKEIWDKYLEHPFLVELGEGTLDKEKFKSLKSFTVVLEEVLRQKQQTI